MHLNGNVAELLEAKNEKLVWEWETPDGVQS